MKKRFFSAFLAICMMLTILPMTAMAADQAEEVDSVFEMQDFNLVPDSNGNYNVGWHYLDGFDTGTITALEVGLKDPTRADYQVYCVRRPADLSASKMVISMIVSRAVRRLSRIIMKLRMRTGLSCGVRTTSMPSGMFRLPMSL